MKDRTFFDTNIYVYFFDRSEKIKQPVASELVRKFTKDSVTVLSYQVVQEFYNLATNKFKKQFSTEDIKYFVETLMYPYCEVFSSFALFELALDISTRYKYGFYDSLIIAASIKSNCKFLYTEDMQNGQVIEGVEIVNPFK